MSEFICHLYIKLIEAHWLFATLIKLRKVIHETCLHICVGFKSFFVSANSITFKMSSEYEVILLFDYYCSSCVTLKVPTVLRTSIRLLHIRNDNILVFFNMRTSVHTPTIARVKFFFLTLNSILSRCSSILRILDFDKVMLYPLV